MSSKFLRDGSVVTWGNDFAGGNSWAVQDQLKGVQQIQATSDAFAAILGDGSVVSWGHIEALVVTVLQFAISLRVPSRFKPRVKPLPRF